MQNSDIIIHTDGSCLNNPGRGGWAAVVEFNGERRELSGGARLSTNNRMELKAAIEALRATPSDGGHAIKLYTDSQLMVNGIELGWARKWRANGWKRNKTDKAENPDLWGQLLEEYEKRKVKFIWTKAHVGTVENERCDELAKSAAEQATARDTVYEDSKGIGGGTVASKTATHSSSTSTTSAQAARGTKVGSAPQRNLFDSSGAGGSNGSLQTRATKGGYQVRLNNNPRSIEIHHVDQGQIQIPLSELAELFELMKQTIQQSSD